MTMKKFIAALVALALALCGAAACAEAGDGTKVNTLIDEGSFIIQIDDPEGDLGWLADDMAQDDSIVTLYDADLIEDTFVARYDPVGDGTICVGVRHYTGIACDEMYTWDLLVADGAVQECVGGSYTASPDETDQDPYLSGEWLEEETQFTQMTIAKGVNRGWDVVIVSPMTHGAYVFKTTVYYDCDLNAFIYDKGKFWDVPITDDEQASLGEAKIAGATGGFSLTGEDGDLRLTWYNDQQPEELTVFRPAGADDDSGLTVDYGASGLYTEAELEAAAALVMDKFASFAGCELHALRYAGDACNTAENLDWLNQLGEGGYVQVAEFTADFHSPAEEAGAWEPDAEYTDYQWWLARTEGGDWELLSWGY